MGQARAGIRELPAAQAHRYKKAWAAVFPEMFAIDTTSAEIDPILDAWLPNKIVMADLKGDRLKGLMRTTITRLAGTSKLLDGVRPLRTK